MRSKQLCVSVQEKTKYPNPGRHAPHEYHLTIILSSPRRGPEPSGRAATLVMTATFTVFSIYTISCSALGPLNARMSLPKVVSSTPPQLRTPVVRPWTLSLHTSKISPASTPLSALISHLSRSLFRFPPFQEFFDPDSSTEILLNTRLMFSLPFLANLESMLSLYKPVPFIELQRPGLTSPRCLTHLAKPQPCKMQLCPFSTSSGAAACGEMQMHLHADCAPLRPTKVSPFQRRCKGRRGREGEERKGRGGGNKPPLTTPTSPISLSPL